MITYKLVDKSAQMQYTKSRCISALDQKLCITRNKLPKIELKTLSSNPIQKIIF